MNLRRLVMRNIVWGGARSVAVFFGAALVAGFMLVSTMVVRGAEANLEQNLERLGADIVVFPWGTRLEELEGGHLMQITSSGWMPRSYVGRIAGLKGVAAASPQLYLATLTGSPYCAAAEMYVIAFDPETDFTLASWMPEEKFRNLALGEAVGGSHIIDPGAAGLDIDGYPLKLAGQLAPTGTDLDETLFVSFETAKDMARQTRGRPGALIKIAPQSATTALVKILPGRNARDVAVEIMEHVPGVISIESAKMLQAQRGQIFGLLTTVLGLMGVIWVLAVVFIGLVFTMTVNSRRRQIGVLAALGAPPSFIMRSLLLEGAVLGMGGGLIGVVAAAIAGAMLATPLTIELGMPFALPTPLGLLGLGMAGLALAMLSVAMAALLPARRISRQEPAVTMRE